LVGVRLPPLVGGWLAADVGDGGSGTAVPVEPGAAVGTTVPPEGDVGVDATGVAVAPGVVVSTGTAGVLVTEGGTGVLVDGGSTAVAVAVGVGVSVGRGVELITTSPTNASD
jgi:hypothetical protein